MGGGAASARRRRGDENGPPPLPFPASLAEDAEAAASAAGALATAAGVLRPLCKFVYAAVHLARGLELCDEGLARLGVAEGRCGPESAGSAGAGDNAPASSPPFPSLESSLPPHVAAAAAPLVRARLVLLDSRARCWLSQSDLASARTDVAAALALAGGWPRAAAPLLAPLLLPLAGIYCLCSREMHAARVFLGVAAAASGPRAYQLQAQRRQQQQQQQNAGTPGATPENRSGASPAAVPSSSSSGVQPPAGPAAPAANAALAAAHAAFAELADPSPAGGGPAARATSVLKAGIAFPAAPAPGPDVPRTHRATAQLALGCTLAASAAASSAAAACEAPAAASAAAAAARARARTCFGSAMAAAQRNLSNLQLTAFALGAMAPLLAHDDGTSDGGGGGAGAGAGEAAGGGEVAAAAGVEAGRTLFVGAMDVAKQIDCPAAVLAATCGWVQQGSGGGGGGGSGSVGAGAGEARASSEAYVARYEAKRAARVAEAKGLAPIPEVQDTEEALAGARAEHEAIVGWMPVCQ